MLFTTVTQLFTRHEVIYHDSLNWRLTPRIVGEINGLPGSRGVLVATNGVLCLIEQELGERLFEGHLDFFLPDIEAPACTPLKRKESAKLTAQYVDILDLC